MSFCVVLSARLLFNDKDSDLVFRIIQSTAKLEAEHVKTKTSSYRMK